jgi:hypothetical protein
MYRKEKGNNWRCYYLLNWFVGDSELIQLGLSNEN